MRSTMPDFPLTLQHFLWRATTLYPDKEIVTRRDQGVHRYHYRAFGERVGRLANALKALGVGAGDRVGTFAWNNYRHLELYFAVPCSGAVLHTVNLRLFPEHLEFVINDAEDRVLFVDASVLPTLERIAGKLPTVRQYVCLTDGPLPDSQLKPMVSYEELLAEQSPNYAWPNLDEREAAPRPDPAACLGHDRDLAGGDHQPGEAAPPGWRGSGAAGQAEAGAARA